MKNETNVKHTPTPWTVTGYAHTLNQPTKGHISGDSSPVAEESYELSYDNAAFIVRAVNSHEALLEVAKEELKDYELIPPHRMTVHQKTRYAKLFGAIAKAEG